MCMTYPAAAAAAAVVAAAHAPTYAPCQLATIRVSVTWRKMRPATSHYAVCKLLALNYCVVMWL